MEESLHVMSSWWCHLDDVTLMLSFYFICCMTRTFWYTLQIIL